MKYRTKEKLLLIFVVLMGMLAAVLVAFLSIRALGKREIKSREIRYQPTFITAETIAAKEEEKEHWQEGWVKFNGKVYQYNSDLTTYLFMGIDKQGKVRAVSEGTNGGQADALFLAVIDSDKKDINIIAINRNSMVDVDVYNKDGCYVTTTKAQVAVQHGFGDGVEKSCEYQTEAVSRMFYNMPIHGYAALNMKAIEVINNDIGGVTLEALSDVKGANGERIVSEGNTVTLNGYQAYWYTRNRDEDVFGSADLRLARQKQYLTALINQAREKIQNDASVATKIYSDVQPYMTTDISFQEIAYLAPLVATYSFDSNAIRTIAGENVMGEEFEEYYIDEGSLYELIIDIFYEEVSFE